MDHFPAVTQAPLGPSTAALLSPPAHLEGLRLSVLAPLSLPLSPLLPVFSLPLLPPPLLFLPLSLSFIPLLPLSRPGGSLAPSLLM